MSRIQYLFAGFGRRLLLAFGLSMALVVFFAGTHAAQTTRAADTSWSYVRVFHASPDAGIVDVFMDGKQILSNFQYGTLTGYTPASTGSHKLQIGVIGSGANAPILSQTLSLQANTAYTAVALGTKSTGYTLQVFADNNVISGNLAKVRVYHLSPGTGVVNVNMGGNTFIHNLPYAQASNYASFSPGSYTFNLVASQGNASSPISVQLKPWTVTSVFVISFVKAGSATNQLQFVQAQIVGTPGMPNTGSDPTPLANAPSQSQQTLFSWLWMLVILSGTCVVVGISRQTRSKQLSGKR